MTRKLLHVTVSECTLKESSFDLNGILYNVSYVCLNAHQVSYSYYLMFDAYDIQHIAGLKSESLKIVSCCIQGLFLQVFFFIEPNDGY